MPAMTILHVTDLHFTERWFAWLHESAPHHDLLCISGDLLDQSRGIPFHRQAALIAEWLTLHPRPVCVCSGNSDLEFLPPGQPRRPATWLRALSRPRLRVDGDTAFLHGRSIEVAGYREAPRGTADIWLVHLPPTDTPVARSEYGIDLGDKGLPALVREHRPRLVLSGHVHHPEAWFHEEDGTIYLNPGCSRGSRIPHHILIEPDRFAATRVTEGPIGSYSETVLWPAAPSVREHEQLSA